MKPEPKPEPDNPCLACGACCAAFRVSFYWGELASAPGGTVPDALTERVGAHLACMRGTERGAGRCVALRGEIGRPGVHCAIYPQRSSTCRGFEARLADGRPDPHCTRARAVFGLPPLVAEVPEAPMSRASLRAMEETDGPLA